MLGSLLGRRVNFFLIFDQSLTLFVSFFQGIKGHLYAAAVPLLPLL